MVDEARSVAGALVVRSLLRGKLQPVESVSHEIDEVMRRYLGPELISNILLDRAYNQDPFFVEYEVLQEEHKLASATVEFFVRAPRLSRPSLGRCRYFIARGGFAPPTAATEICPPRAVSTSKKAWHHYAAVSPFLLAAKISKIPFVDLAPDSDDALAKLSRYSERNSMLKFFELANSIQRQLKETLDATAGSKVTFIDLPDELGETAPNLQEFSSQQLKLLRSYSVENATKLRLR